jgi:hypothetical protein
VTGAIAGRFGVSLSAVGLTMTVFFATITAVTIGSAQVLRRLGPRPAIAVCCLLAALGNVVCAVSPSFAGVLVGHARGRDRARDRQRARRHRCQLASLVRDLGGRRRRRARAAAAPAARRDRRSAPATGLRSGGTGDAGDVAADRVVHRGQRDHDRGQLLV